MLFAFGARLVAEMDGEGLPVGGDFYRGKGRADFCAFVVVFCFLFFGQHEQAGVVQVFLVVFGGVGGNQFEVDAVAVAEGKAVVTEVLAGFGVVLVFVRPVQHHFFAVVGDGVGVALVAALADEVACVVVAREEGEQVVVDGSFLRFVSKRRLDLRGQFPAEVVVDFRAAAVQDAVDAEIEVGAVGLEDFFEFGDEFVKACHGCSGWEREKRQYCNVAGLFGQKKEPRRSGVFI